MNSDVETTLSVLLGHAAWSVRRTHGSCFFMEFGAPHKTIREPLPVRDGMPQDQALMRRRRRISFRGDWSLLVYASNWSLRVWEFYVNHDSIQQDMELPFAALDGQYLNSINYEELTKSVTLTFDLGGELRLWPSDYSDDDEDQWAISSVDNVYRGFLKSGVMTTKSGDEP